MIAELEYLENRIRLFFKFLEDNNIEKIFPYRNESLKEIEIIIKSQNVRKLKNFNKLLNNLIIGNNGFTREQKFELLNYLSSKLKKDETLIDDKKEFYKKIINLGIIKSRVEINEMIEILNSDILNLTDSDKVILKEIIGKSMLIRI
jgi:hypothetical protein